MFTARSQLVLSIAAVFLIYTTWKSTHRSVGPSPEMFEVCAQRAPMRVESGMLTGISQQEAAPPACSQVLQAPDQCAFVRKYCSDEDDGRIPYLRLFYCSLGPANRAAWFVLVPMWTILLFTTISVCAGDFFAVNLSSIAHALHMSDTFAGVTLLALGNGGPDIFSTWAAVSSGSLQLAVGEIVGATCFIITVVAGAIACTTTFQLRRASLLRDAFFLFGTVALLLGVLVLREIRLWQGLLMIVIYIIYVSWVMGYHHWISRHQGAEETASSPQIEEANATAPTEASPLLHSSNSPRKHTTHEHKHHRKPAALYREIEEWRHAHGRCITGQAGYIFQPSLAGSVEYSARKRRKRSEQHAASDAERRPDHSDEADSTPLPRLDQSEIVFWTPCSHLCAASRTSRHGVFLSAS